jgi:hypothetical protein
MDGKINREPLLSTQQNQLSGLLSDAASIDAKALGLFAANITVLIFIGQSTFVLEWWGWSVMLVPFFMSLVYDAVALYPRKYVSTTIDIDKHPEYLAMDEETLTLQLISDAKSAIDTNTRLNRQRWSLCALSFLLSLVGSLVLLTTLGVQ